MTDHQFRRAVRADVPLLIGLAGASGSGKTYSAMTLAKGMAGDRPFAVIDTEAGRARHYADRFTFDHADLHPPFEPDAYLAAIIAADKAKYPVIVVDSMSHEWAGEGGILDMQEAAFRAKNYAESARMSSWIKPKQAHKAMVQKLLQVRAHVILCFRAEPKVDMVRNPDTGKTEIVDKKGPGGFKGWLPICEKNLPYELTASFLFMAEAPGVPLPMKLQEQHKAFFPDGRVVTEDAGRQLAAWAKGGVATPEVERPGTADAPAAGGAPSDPPTEPPYHWTTEELKSLFEIRAMSVKDLTPAIGPTDKDTLPLALDAWFIAHPGKQLPDLFNDAIERSSAPQKEQQAALT